MKKQLALGLLLGSFALQAAVVNPISYSMPNGSSGSYNYWDESYTGSGNPLANNSPLSGGLGDLTDGIVAPDNWFVTEAVPGPGPYVGWQNIDPLITFEFAAVTDFTTVRIHFDDSQEGGVTGPVGVTINGTNFAVTDPAGSAPFWAEFDISGFASSNQLAIQLHRSDIWVFASEFQFEDASLSAVPEPSTMFIMGGGLSALALLRRRFRK
jgi:hypothetical protein